MAIPSNTRIEVTIYPWAVQSTTGDTLASEYTAIWFTKLTPMYSHLHAVETELGSQLGSLSKVLIKLAIWEASRYADWINQGDCPEPDLTYLDYARRRLVTLRALLSLIGNTLGLSPVTRKKLGDFEIEFDTKSNSNSIVPRLMKEIAELEPVVASGGCIGLRTSHKPTGVQQGAADPYHGRPTRTILPAQRGSDPTLNGYYSSGHHARNPLLFDRWGRANETWVPRRRR